MEVCDFGVSPIFEATSGAQLWGDVFGVMTQIQHQQQVQKKVGCAALFWKGHC